MAKNKDVSTGAQIWDALSLVQQILHISRTITAYFPYIKMLISSHAPSRKHQTSVVDTSLENCASSVQNLLHFTFLSPRVWRWPLKFWKIWNTSKSVHRSLYEYILDKAKSVTKAAIWCWWNYSQFPYLHHIHPQDISISSHKLKWGKSKIYTLYLLTFLTSQRRSNSHILCTGNGICNG